MIINSNQGFYVGDPCYVLHEDNYDGVFGAANYEDGQYTGKNLAGEEFDFALGGTRYGDGEYQDQHGHRYGVDAGIIGVVPLELCEKYGTRMSEEELNNLGHVFYGKEARFSADDGEFSIEIGDETIYIDTGEDEDDEDDDYWNYYGTDDDAEYDYDDEEEEDDDGYENPDRY